MAIQRTEDPAITELERILAALQIKVTLVYANLFEANFGLDQIKDVEFPVFVYFADDKSKYGVKEYGMMTRKLTVNGLMVGRFSSPTSDYSSSDVNPLINQMRQLVENMIYNLNKSPLSVWEDEKDKGGVDDFDTENTYQRFDDNLFGVGVSFTWKIKTTMGAYT